MRISGPPESGMEENVQRTATSVVLESLGISAAQSLGMGDADA